MLHVLTLACFTLAPLQDREASVPVAGSVLPESSIAFVEVPDPTRLVNTLANHPVIERIKADKTLSKAWNSADLMKARAGIRMAEVALGKKIPDIVDILGGKGVAAAFDPKTEGVILIARSGQPEEFAALLDKIIQFTQQNQKMATDTYRGVSVMKLDKAAMARFKDGFIMTNKPELGKHVIDAMLSSDGKSLSKNATFVKAGFDQPAKDETARLFVDTAALKKLGAMDKIEEGLKSNPLAELILGGVIESLTKSDFVVADASLTDTRFHIGARTPYDPASISEPREFYFGNKGTGRAPRPIQLESTILNLTTYRDISKMWLYAGDLFDQRINDGFAEAESTLSTLFAGKDFVEEILGEIKPTMQLIVARDDFKNTLPKPALKFPSFAIVGEFKDAARMNKEMKRTFNSMIGFFNVVGAMEGNPQMDMDMDMEDGVKFMTSSFVPLPEDEKSENASVHYNFTPTLGMADDQFVLSSSLELARKVMAARKNAANRGFGDQNLEMTLRGPALKTILADNEEKLIANNMLEEGNTREEAELQIGLLLRVVGWFDNFSTTLRPAEDQLQLNFDLVLKK